MNKLIKIYEEVGGNPNMWYECDVCGGGEFPTYENGETGYTRIFKYENKIYCEYCINDAVNKIEQV